MEERFEVISPSLNGYAYIHDFKTDNVLNTYDSCDLLNQQDKRIKELEKIKGNEALQHFKLLNYEIVIKNLQQENQQLKQQFVEKDKDIEKVKKSKTYIMNFGSKVKEVQVVDDNQDKISFALEQLEEIINLFEPYENAEKDTILCANNGVSFLEYIDQQIALLKGKVEDEVGEK